MFQRLVKKPSCQDCISEFTWRHESCGKKHHTLLHDDKKPMPNSNSPANSNNANTAQTARQQNLINTDDNPEIPLVVKKIKNTSSENSHVFLQVLPKYQTEINLLQQTRCFIQYCTLPFQPKM